MIMRRYFLPLSFSCIILVSCSSRHYYAPSSPLETEKDQLLQQTNRSYSDASILGSGASLINILSPASFLESAKSIDGIEVDEETGVLSMKHSVLFDFNSYHVKEEAIRPLSELVEVFSRHGKGRLLITGHTDNIGSASYNKQLSLKRAEAVSSFLKDLGLTEEQLSTAGKGSSDPVSTNKTELGRSKNRRVEFRLISK